MLHPSGGRQPAGPLERLNKEIKRGTDVVGVFPNPAALLRLAGQARHLNLGEARASSLGSVTRLPTKIF